MICWGGDRALLPSNRGHDDLVRVGIDEHTRRFRFEFQRLKYEFFPPDKLQVGRCLAAPSDAP